MPQSKHQWYKNGVDNQKRADITMDLRRLDEKQINKLSIEQKESLKESLGYMKAIFGRFIESIEENIK